MTKKYRSNPGIKQADDLQFKQHLLILIAKKNGDSGATSYNDGHSHTYRIDNNGNGFTESTFPLSHQPHKHMISVLMVQPGELNGHIHNLNPMEHGA